MHEIAIENFLQLISKNMDNNKVTKKLDGANMDIDLFTNEKNIHWKQDKCPWNGADGQLHKCAVKNVSLCEYFWGIEKPDKIICLYGGEER